MIGQKQFLDFMIDIETLGLEPNRHAIIQISAVPFNFHTREIAETYFDKCLAVPNWRHYSQDTMSWWLSKNVEVYNSIIARMESPAAVMEWFEGFVRNLAGGDLITKRYPSKDKEPRFWYKRPFDWQFVEGYFKDFGIKSPFHYHNAIEMTAFLKGCGRGLTMAQLDIKSDGPAHDAYFDATLQIKKLFATIDYYAGER